MTQVQLSRTPYAEHTFYNGVYTHKNIEYSFTLTVEESEISVQPAITIEFDLEPRLLPFYFGDASKEILAVYLPDGNQEAKN
jgi:hypothetical protein